MKVVVNFTKKSNVLTFDYFNQHPFLNKNVLYEKKKNIVILKMASSSEENYDAIQLKTIDKNLHDKNKRSKKRENKKWSEV